MSGRGQGVRLSRDGAKKIALDIDTLLLAEIDQRRGSMPRAEWIRNACRVYADAFPDTVDSPL